MTPALAGDFDLLGRPVTYITWSAQSNDGKPHDSTIFFSASGALTVNIVEQPVNATRLKSEGRTVLRIGSSEQPILREQGDDLRIDWGQLYAVPDSSQQVTDAIADGRRAQLQFTSTGDIPDSDDFQLPRPAGRKMEQSLSWDEPILAFRIALGTVGTVPVHRYILLAYDEIYSVQFLERRLRPYWRRNGARVTDLLDASIRDYESLNAKCEKFDDELMADMKALGGEKYALLTALAYRQSLGAQTLAAGYDGRPLLFPKENSSNGDISTVDVIFPDAPLLLLLNPELAEASVIPVLEYVNTGRWPFPWAPHDLGVYPLADGYTFPPDVSQKSSDGIMPVEETANMIILGDAIAQIRGTAELAEKYWPLFETWAKYLRENGLDPELQLSSDDFAGKIAHSANLSVKAIVGLAAYAQLCDRLGKSQEAAEYREVAKDYASDWARMDADGDHYRLAFDKPGTFSQKYNLIWDRILHLNTFPPGVAEKEIAFYLQHQNAFGFPLDSRADFTKLDWLFWSASLADRRSNFEALIAPAYKFANETPDREPLGDLYFTTTGRRSEFVARSVVGGIYIRALTDETMWNKWAANAQSAPKAVSQAAH
jgi:hypothetical protein